MAFAIGKRSHLPWHHCSKHKPMCNGKCSDGPVRYRLPVKRGWSYQRAWLHHWGCRYKTDVPSSAVQRPTHYSEFHVQEHCRRDDCVKQSAPNFGNTERQHLHNGWDFLTNVQLLKIHLQDQGQMVAESTIISWSLIEPPGLDTTILFIIFQKEFHVSYSTSWNFLCKSCTD